MRRLYRVADALTLAVLVAACAFPLVALAAIRAHQPAESYIWGAYIAGVGVLAFAQLAAMRRVRRQLRAMRDALRREGVRP